MHAAALAWVTTNIGDPATVLEFGSLNINGSARECAPNAQWFGIDLCAGPGVDAIAHAATYQHPTPVACVVCCEMLEHDPAALRAVTNAWTNLAPGGTLIVTAACDDRAPHSAVDGGPIRPDEYYRNVDPTTFLDLARSCGFEILATETHPTRGDFYMKARKPHG